MTTSEAEASSLPTEINPIPTPVEADAAAQTKFAQEMTDAMYSAHAAINEATMGAVSEAMDTDEMQNTTTTEMQNTTTNENTAANDNTTTNTTEPTPSAPSASSSSTHISPQLAKEQIKYCQRILKGLKRHRDAPPFLQPVDPVALNIPDYFTVIKHPMDLSTISKKMDLNEYVTAEAFMADVRLMLNNCFTYNGPDSQVTKMGRNLEKYFNTSMAKLPTTEQDLQNASAIAVTPSGEVRPRRESAAPSAASRSATFDSMPRRSSAAPAGSMSFCSGVLRELMKKTNAHLNWPFMIPVDPVALNIPDYFDIIKHPMDLGTIRKKLDTGMYSRPEQFEEDVRLVFSNCYTYNPPESDVHRMGRELEAIFDAKWAAKPQPKPPKEHSAPKESSHHHHREAYPTSTGSSVSSIPRFMPSSASQLIPGFDALETDSEKILAINYQIQVLQAELNALVLGRRVGGGAAGGSGYASMMGSSSSSVMASGPVSGAPARQRSASSSAAGSKKKASSAAVTSPLQSASAANTGSSNTASTTSTSTNAFGLTNEQLATPMTFAEKQKLSEDVGLLAAEQLMHVLEIIQECMPSLRNSGDSDVIELDIEALDVRTLRTLQAYIWECMNPGKKRKTSSSGKPVTKKEKLHETPSTLGTSPPSATANHNNPVSSTEDDESTSEDDGI